MCQKYDRFQAFVGAFPRYLGERVAESDKEEWWRTEKELLTMPPKLGEKADLLKTPGSMANYLENGFFNC